MKKATPKNGLNRATDKTNHSTIEPLQSTNKYSQHAIIVSLLRDRPYNTLEFRALGVPHPSGRIMELNSKGYVIDATYGPVTGPTGLNHPNIATYTLISERGAKL